MEFMAVTRPVTFTTSLMGKCCRVRLHVSSLFVTVSNLNACDQKKANTKVKAPA